MVLVTRRDASQILADSRGVVKPRNFSKELKGLSKKKKSQFLKSNIFSFSVCFQGEIIREGLSQLASECCMGKDPLLRYFELLLTDSVQYTNSVS